MPPEDVRAAIDGARRYFEALASRPQSQATIQIWLLPIAPMLTFYRFDRRAVFTIYNHQRDRAPVPTFIVEQGGTLYDFIRSEFDAMIKSDGGLARCVFPRDPVADA
jgi:hypothetical protein